MSIFANEGNNSLEINSKSKMVSFSSLNTICPFCQELFGDRSSLVSTIGSDINRVIIENSYGVCVPSLGQIIENHLLIIPKKHTCSMAELDSKEFEECLELVNSIKCLFIKEYGGYTIFEHGMDHEGLNGGCGIAHAHFHLVPKSWQMLPAFALFKFTKVGDLPDIRKYKDTGYLLIQNNSGTWIATPKFVESQYLRKVLAEEVGNNSEWDWKVFPKSIEISKSVILLRSKLLSEVSLKSPDEQISHAIKTAEIAAKNGNCQIKKVGAVIFDDHKIICEGWNESLGNENCENNGHLWKGGHCVRTIHAESSAISKAAKIGKSIDGLSIATTAFPCYDCAKLIVNSGIKKVICLPYAIDINVFKLFADNYVELLVLN